MIVPPEVALALSGVCLNVCSNAVYDIVTLGAKADLKDGERTTNAFDAQPNESLAQLLASTLEVFASKASVDFTIAATHLRRAILSPELAAILRLIYCYDASAGLTVDEKTPSLKEVRALFRQTMELLLPELRGAEDTAFDSLFEALIEATRQSLSEAANQGLLAAHEALSNERHRALLAELRSVRGELGFLSGNRIPELQEIDSFDAAYRKQVAQRHGSVTPPNVGSQVKVSIDRIFVAPRLSRVNSSSAEEQQVGLTALLTHLRHTVVLGTPGGGKSTLATKVCYDLATRFDQNLCSGRRLTPVLVVLREYMAAKRSRPCSILEFIELQAGSRYQVMPPKNVFEYLLRKGRVTVILDGLDELLETQDRAEVSSDVESFATAYPLVPILVTSREVGYEQAPLDPEMFIAFRLAPFVDEQITDYVTKWFDLEEGLSVGEAQIKRAGFLRESAIVPDLRSNPLMLALMCRIYTGENYIPQNRPDVYEKCSTMLFEQWDRNRDIKVGGAVGSITAHVRPAMMHLALWVYERPDGEGGIVESKLIAELAQYLHKRRFEDEIEAESVARDFAQFLCGRAWVLSDTGTRPSGERIFQFTHRTFLEYFAANQLVRVCGGPATLADRLLPRLQKSEWDVVAQLAIQIQNRTLEDAGDKMVRLLLDASSALNGNEKLSILSFTTRLLDFLVPRPGLIREMVDRGIDACVDHAIAMARARDEQVKQATPARHFVVASAPGTAMVDAIQVAFARCLPENAPILFDQLVKHCTELSKAPPLERAIVSFDFVLTLNGRMQSDGPAASREQVAGLLQGAVVSTIRDLGDRVRELFVASRAIANSLVMGGFAKLDEMILVHGAESMFRTEYWPSTLRIAHVPVASLVMMNLKPDGNENPWVKMLTDDVETALLKSPTPWLEARGQDHYYRPTMDVSFLTPTGAQDVVWKLKLETLTRSQRAILIFVVAVVLELKSRSETPTAVLKAKPPGSTDLAHTLFARFEENQSRAGIMEAISRLKISPPAEKVLLDWAQGDTTFVAS